MRTVVLALILVGCSPASFVTVKDRKDVPVGSKEFSVAIPLDSAALILKSAGLVYGTSEFGLQTEAFQIDNGTKAQIRVMPDGSGVKVIPYWGVTDQVRTTMNVVVGFGAGNNTYEMKRISYGTAKTRAKMVFDYTAQLFEKYKLRYN